MKIDGLELDVLKRQNREMAIKIQFYRDENKKLKSKNEELNQWVGNLSQVFSTVSASWESITVLEETLLVLMKKKSDMKDKTTLRKYQFHFKTFNDVITNLSDKIKNTGHSEQATQQAKEQLRSFVKNYELFFSEFIETYFKFNDEYTQILNTLKTREDINQSLRSMIPRFTENTQKIKQFQVYVQSLKDNFKFFEEYNNKKLLEGVVQKKEEEIQVLKDKLFALERRVKIMFDYNSASIDMQIECPEQAFQCTCGGAQLNYMKKCWEDRITQNEATSLKKIQDGGNVVKSESVEALEAKLAVVQQEKQNLIKRNSLLLQKISKMNIQYKLTDEIVLRSNVYLALKQQCQYLMEYITELLNKLKKQQDFLYQIEKSRDDEIKELKKKQQKGKIGEQKSTNGFHGGPNSTQIFKTDALNLISNFTNAFNQLVSKSNKFDQSFQQQRQKLIKLKKSNDDLNKKVGQLQARELNRTENLQFKHQKYKQIDVVVSGLLQKNQPNLMSLWKQFVQYVKNRDKKIKDLEATTRNKQKQLEQKKNVEQIMDQQLTQIQLSLSWNNQSVKKIEQFQKNMKDQLVRLADDNYQTRSTLEQQKNLLSLRLKAETDARNKLQQKSAAITKITTQIEQIRQNQNRILKDNQIWLQNQKKQLQNLKKQIQQKQIQLKSQIDQNVNKEKQLQNLQKQKQSLKSDNRQLKNQVDSLMTTTQNQVLKLQLNEYKSKIMCSCTGDRQREVVLKTCPHLFCKRCIEDTTNNRNRKCPHCGIRFTKSDIHEIKWN